MREAALLLVGEGGAVGSAMGDVFTKDACAGSVS